MDSLTSPTLYPRRRVTLSKWHYPHIKDHLIQKAAASDFYKWWPLISEIRKNWTSLEGKKNTGENEPSGQGLSKLDDVILRLEALSSAYTDIQDRLYELDKSWKNNLMIYGVPCCDGEEDNPIITEEKVISIIKEYIYQKFNHYLLVQNGIWMKILP